MDLMRCEWFDAAVRQIVSLMVIILGANDCDFDAMRDGEMGDMFTSVVVSEDASWRSRRLQRRRRWRSMAIVKL